MCLRDNEAILILSQKVELEGMAHTARPVDGRNVGHDYVETLFCAWGSSRKQRDELQASSKGGGRRSAGLSDVFRHCLIPVRQHTLGAARGTALRVVGQPRLKTFGLAAERLATCTSAFCTHPMACKKSLQHSYTL